MKAVSPVPFRLAELDGIRGLAAILIVYIHLFHSWVPNSPAPLFWARNFSALSWTGVHLFFILSGFLIGGILIRQRGSSSYFKVFYLRRALRIFPLYFLLVATVFVVLPFLNTPDTSPSAIPTWSYLVFMQNFYMAATGQWGLTGLGVTWSVAVEEQFYVFAPLLIAFIPLRFLPICLLAALGLAPALRQLSPFPADEYILFGAIDSLALGTLFAWVYHYHLKWFMNSRARIIAALASVVGVITLCLGVFGYHFSPFKETFIAAAWGGFFWLVLSYLGTAITAPLRTSLLVWMGGRSYAIYLFHSFFYSIVLYLLTGSFSNRVNLTTGLFSALSAFGLTLLFAWASYRWIEGPLIKLGQRLIYSPPYSSPLSAIKPEPQST